MTRRQGLASPLESAFPAQAIRSIDVVGLSSGAIRRLLDVRLGLSLSRRVLRQLMEATLGNPLFALEIGRTLVERGTPPIGETFDLPDSLVELLTARTAASPEARVALLAVALGGSLTIAEVAAVIGQSAIDAAVDARLLLADDMHLRPAHPLLASAVIKSASARERREIHRGLARIAAHPVRRARHLAAVAMGPDPELAVLVAAGAADAIARAATEEAIELAEHAFKLTPADEPARGERLLQLGDYLLRADEGVRLKQVLSAGFDALTSDLLRARGHLLLAQVAESQDEFVHHVETALREGHDFDEIRAAALATQSLDAALSFVERLDEADEKAREALRLAGNAPVRAFAVHANAWVRLMRGQRLSDLRPLLQGVDVLGEHSLERTEGIQLAFRGLVDEARAVFRRLVDRAELDGNENARSYYLHHLCEVELRAGDRVAVERLLDDRESTEDSVRGGYRGEVARLRTVAAALEGNRTLADTWATRTLAVSIGQRWDLFETRRAQGIAALAADDPARAVEHLLVPWRHTVQEGIDEPGAFPVAGDLVEAALASGDLRLAKDVMARLADLSAAQAHPWGLASVERCEGLLAMAMGGDQATPNARLLAAAEQYAAIGCRFEAARALLAVGRNARRGRQWAVARDALGRAASAFDELGCSGWAARARELVTGVGGRRPTAPASLTPSERRVSELASQGFSNREIAASLFVSEHTVEVHLAHAYPKLGVHSRAQLARALESAD